MLYCNPRRVRPVDLRRVTSSRAVQFRGGGAAPPAPLLTEVRHFVMASSASPRKPARVDHFFSEIRKSHAADDRRGDFGTDGGVRVAIGSDVLAIAGCQLEAR